MPAERARPPALARRLAAAGIDDVTDPLAAWIRLREAEGRRTTGDDLYELVAGPRGLAARELPRGERAGLAMSAMPVLFPGFVLVPGSGRHGDML